MATDEQVTTYGVFVARGDVMHNKATFNDLDAALHLARRWLQRGRDVEIDVKVMSLAEFAAHPDATEDTMMADEPEAA